MYVLVYWFPWCHYGSGISSPRLAHPGHVGHHRIAHRPSGSLCPTGSFSQDPDPTDNVRKDFAILGSSINSAEHITRHIKMEMEAGLLVYCAAAIGEVGSGAP